MPLSWNEIKSRAVAFSHKWQDETSEDAEAKPFWVDFFNVFGIDRKRVATFEERVQKLDGSDGYIDLLWKGVILVEHKSGGKNLFKAQEQAAGYLYGLRDYELPRFMLICDFQNFRLIDLTDDIVTEFTLSHLHEHVHRFGFMIGYVSKTVKAEDPVNIKAAERMGALHDRLKESGYSGHELELLLVRNLFCLFAEDTGIFQKAQFQDYIGQRTNVDGTDLGMHIAQLFQILDTPRNKRHKTLDEQLAAFPYINGSLFSEPLPIAAFDSLMRDSLVEASALDWSRISPAIFGSLFQSVMNPKERRALGAHYTSEINILKLISPLFLDDLKAEFESCKNSVKKLESFHKKIASLTFLDPACGCGNFLIIAYRELRLLEQAVIRELYKGGQLITDISHLVRVSIEQFHGIEIEEFPARIAEVALWLVDHQMNLAISEEFGEYFVRIPLSKIETVVCKNALTSDWPEVDFILGNPPFVGKTWQTKVQKENLAKLFEGINGAGNLDFVSCWFLKAARYMHRHPSTRTAFVSTNSICQGEQVSVLWNQILRLGLLIHFAHRTFVWSNDAKGKAAVHCIIVGFGVNSPKTKSIFDYPDPKGEPVKISVSQINPYLVDAPPIIVQDSRVSLSAPLPMGYGNKPVDGGHLIFTTEEKESFLMGEPNALKWFKKFLGSDEFINGKDRWCLWLVGITPAELRAMPRVMERIELVRKERLESPKIATQKLAKTPSIFAEIRHKGSNSLAIPEVSSERRSYIPIGFLDGNIVASNKIYTVPDATLYHFGILHSTMHNAWMRTVAGRMKSDYSYSNTIVYNNFPWPNPTLGQRAAIEIGAQSVLDARSQFPASSLADLYDPLTMPPALLKAHQTLDRSVDIAYGKKKFSTESERVSFLFERYKEIINPLGLPFTEAKNKKVRKSKS